MRSILAIATLIWASGCAQASYARPIVIADIDRSEWTPSMLLTLDTGTGRYTIVPPLGPWPAMWPKPQPRNGTLTGDALNRVRLSLNKVISVWQERGDGSSTSTNCAVPAGNAGTPFLRVEIGEETLASTNCWTPAEFEFRHLLDDLFDHKSP